MHVSPYRFKRGKKVLAISAFAALAFAAGAEREAPRKMPRSSSPPSATPPIRSRAKRSSTARSRAMNKENLAFVVHIGDFEADPRPYTRSPDKISMPCTDESLCARARFIRKIRASLRANPGRQ
jgi:hypothetical protein